MNAPFQSLGTVPWSYEAWKIRVRTGDMLDAISFRKREEISSGPLILCGFKPSSIFLTPFSCMTSGGAPDFRLFPMGGILLPW